MKVINLDTVKFFKITAAFFLFFPLLSCTPYQTPLMVGAAPWPNFEFAFLADELDYLDHEQYDLVELTSPSSVIQAIQTEKLDVAFLSLDEVLTLVSLGVDLKIISVIDNATGGDALLAKAGITSLQALNGLRIGYEKKTAGSLLLNDIFTLTNLNMQTRQLHEVAQNEAKDAYLKDRVDALIVREPVKQELLALGAIELFNSTALSTPITHVMIARSDILEQKEKQISYFIKQYYRAQQFFIENNEQALTLMAARLQLHPQLLQQSFIGANFINAKQALMSLSGSPSNVELQAQHLNTLMSEKQMFPAIKMDLSSIISTQTLEHAIYE